MTHEPGIRTDPEVVVDLPCETGEGPLWHDSTSTLLWVDIPAGTLYRYDPAGQTNEVVYQRTGSIGGYTIQEDDSLIIFSDDGEISRLRNGELETIIPRIDAVIGSRFNDVIADPEGRIFCGTMALENGAAHLYRLDPDASLHLVYDDLTQGNGMGFSPDLSIYYLTDSNSHSILRAAYDRETGELTDREVLLQTSEDQGVPDGMTVDTDGTIWSGQYGGGGLFHYSDKGEPLEKVSMPVKNVTSITFGGEGYETAWITTAGGSDRGPENGQHAGSLFRMKLNATGRPPFRSRIGL
jgi:D-xylonolactonase